MSISLDIVQIMKRKNYSYKKGKLCTLEYLIIKYFSIFFFQNSMCIDDFLFTKISHVKYIERHILCFSDINKCIDIYEKITSF